MKRNNTEIILCNSGIIYPVVAPVALHKTTYIYGQNYIPIYVYVYSALDLDDLVAIYIDDNIYLVKLPIYIYIHAWNS